MQMVENHGNTGTLLRKLSISKRFTENMDKIQFSLYIYKCNGMFIDTFFINKLFLQP